MNEDIIARAPPRACATTAADPNASCALDSLTRLLARLLDAPVAMVTVPGRRPAWLTSSAACGVADVTADETPDRPLCDIVLRTGQAVLVPDLAADPRFQHLPSVVGRPHLRAYFGVPLIDSLGCCIGVLCAQDIRPRAKLRADQETALQDLASLALHLLQQRLADDRLAAMVRRATRIEALQSAIAASPTCEQALTAALHDLCRFHGAAIGRIWKLVLPAETMLEVSRFQDDLVDGQSYFSIPPVAPVTSRNSNTAASIRANKPAMLHYAEIENPQSFALVLAAMQAGLTCQVSYPIWVQDERFGIAMSFRSALTPLQEVVDDIASLEDIIRPALQRKVAEERMLMLGNTLDRAVDGVLVTDASLDDGSDRPIVYANSGFCQMFGYSLDEVLGQTTAMVRGPRTNPEHIRFVEAAMRAFRPVRAEVLNYRRDGSTLWVEIDLAPMRDANGTVTHWVSIRRDITRRRFQEEALIRAEKLKTVGQLTGGIAHDFNNLLTVVTLNIEEALDRLAPADPLHALLAPAMHASLRGAELTAQLLSYARRAPLRPQSLRVGKVLSDLLPLLRRSLGERYEIRMLQHEPGLVVNADAGQLENAVMNLVINARDAMAGGGLILLEVQSVELVAGSSALQDDMKPGRYARVSVTDTGSGIDAAVLGRVFDPFFTTKPVGQGSGLGLSMVYGFARQSGGHCLIRSIPRHGTVVSLILPAQGDSAGTAEPDESGARPGPWQARGRRVLVVEDQPEVLSTVLYLLGTLDFRVTGVGTADAAAGLMRTGATFDLLFSDVVLPGTLSGLDLVQLAREIAPLMPVLVTSGFTQQSKPLSDALAAGAAFITKPYKRRDLIEKFREIFP